MNAYEMIARYAHAVARRLPQAMREDVRAELQALLAEELEAKTSGAPDEAAARALLADFGAPASVALTYHTPAPVIDPHDVRLFGKIAMVGLTALAVLAISVALSDPGADAQLSSRIADEATQLGLQGLGALLVVFWGLGVLRRRVLEGAWSPRSLPPVGNPDAINRPLTGLAIAFWSAGLAILMIGPASVFASAMGGAAPAPLLEAFTYDAAFAAERAPFLWAALAIAIAVTAWQVIAGRRTATSRRVEAVVSLALSALLFQIVLAGDIFAAEPANQYMKLAMALFAGWGFIDGAGVLLREMRERSQRPAGSALS